MKKDKDIVPGPGRRAEVQAGDDSLCRIFPHIAEVFGPTPEKAIALLAEKSESYKKQAESGLPNERVNARTIAVGYDRVRELLQELEAARLQFLKGRTGNTSNIQRDEMKMKARSHGKL